MKIGIVSPYALPEKGAASMRVDSFQKYFNREGHETTIISPQRKQKSKKGVFRYKNYFELMSACRNKDVVVISCPPIKITFPLILFLRMSGTPTILDIRDLAKNGKKKNIKILLEGIAAKSSSKITCVTNYVKNYFSKTYGVDRKDIKVVSNGVDTEIFFPSRKSDETRNKLGIPKDAKVLIYEGIVGDHGLKHFLENMPEEIIFNKKFYIILAVIAGDTEKKSIKKLKSLKTVLMKKNIANRVIIIKNKTPEEIRDYISCSNIGLASIPSDDNNLYRVPIKAYEYAACGIPILGKGPSGGELDKFIKTNKIGYFSESWNDALRNLAVFLKSDNKINIDNKILKYIDRKKSAKVMLELINEIAVKK